MPKYVHKPAGSIRGSAEDPAQLVEFIAKRVCNHCGSGRPRWQNPDYAELFEHDHGNGDEVACDASDVLYAAKLAGVSIESRRPTTPRAAFRHSRRSAA